MSELTEFKCPLCGKPLASDEYYHAVGDLRKKVEETYDEQVRNCKLEYEQKLTKLEQARSTEAEALKKGFGEQLSMLQQTLETSYKSQLEDLKRNYDKVNSDGQEQFRLLEEKLKADHKKDLGEKDKELDNLRNEQNRLKDLAKEEARKDFENERKRLADAVVERDIQISRFKTDIDGLKEQLTQSQAELKGEVGERDLYATLTEAFPEDNFRRQKRGTSSGDLIQRVSLTPGKYSEMPIVYDNKEADLVTKHDIGKAKSYKDLHGTNYVLIVSSNLPKEIKNGYFGEKDGVFLVHRSIVVEIAGTIRNAIIELAKQTEGAKDRDTKESRLYDYIKGQDFSRKVERFLSIYQRLQKLQETEERSHNRLWKDRRSIQSEINQAYTEITNEIASIIQQTPAMNEFLAEEDQIQDENQEGIRARSRVRR
jgi:hypothetical protein